MKVIKNNLFMIKYIAKYCPFHMIVVLINSSLDSCISIINLLYLNSIIKSVTGNVNLMRTVYLVIIMLIINIVSSCFTMIVRSWLIPKNSLILNQKMQAEIFKKIMEIDYETYENMEFYNKLTGAAQQSDTRALAVLDTFANIIANLFSIGALLALITSFEIIILLFVTINVIVNVLIYVKTSKIRHDQYEESILIKRDADYSGRIFYSYYYAKEIKMFPKFPILVLSKFYESTNKLIVIMKKYVKKSFLFYGLQTVVSLGIDSIITLYLAFKVFNKYMDIADFITVSNGVSQLTGKVTQLALLIPNLYEHSIYIENYKSFMFYSPIMSSGAKEISEDIDFNINFKNVYFKYPNTNVNILQGINLRINQNEKVAFVGRNGAGKTTLIKLLCRLYDCTSGNIYLNDKPYFEFQIKQIRDKISIIFQEINVFSFTIAENILMRKYDEKKDRNLVLNALRKVGLYDKVMKLQNGIETRLTREFDDTGAFFSGGEYQKLVIARCFVKKSKVLIFDEPSSSLDAISEKNIFKIAMEMVKDKSMVFISHRLANIKDVDRIYFIENGFIVEEGTHEDLMKHNGKYADLYKIQSEGYKID